MAPNTWSLYDYITWADCLCQRHFFRSFRGGTCLYQPSLSDSPVSSGFFEFSIYVYPLCACAVLQFYMCILINFSRKLRPVLCATHLLVVVFFFSFAYILIMIQNQLAQLAILIQVNIILVYNCCLQPKREKVLPRFFFFLLFFRWQWSRLQHSPDFKTQCRQGRFALKAVLLEGYAHFLELASRDRFSTNVSLNTTRRALSSQLHLRTRVPHLRVRWRSSRAAKLDPTGCSIFLFQAKELRSLHCGNNRTVFGLGISTDLSLVKYLMRIISSV